MTEETKSKASHKSKNASISQPTSQKMTPVQLAHQYKLTLANDCKIFGKDYKESQLYFIDHGFKLGETQWKQLRKELKSTKRAKNWFSKEALYAIEDDHMLSVERIRSLEDKLVNEMNKLISDDDFDTVVSYSTDTSGIVKLRVKNYNLELLMKLVAQFQSLQETKTKMFSATPMVQEMLEVHRRQEEEEQTPPTMPKKEITNETK